MDKQKFEYTAYMIDIQIFILKKDLDTFALTTYQHQQKN
jgi:hypothetical protein